MEEKELLQKVTALKELKQKSITTLNEIEILENEIKNHMEKNNLREIHISIFTIRYQSIYTSRFNVSAFRREHQDLYKSYLITKKTKRLTIM